jgi:hypothetical protein
MDRHDEASSRYLLSERAYYLLVIYKTFKVKCLETTVVRNRDDFVKKSGNKFANVCHYSFPKLVTPPPLPRTENINIWKSCLRVLLCGRENLSITFNINYRCLETKCLGKHLDCQETLL